MSPNGVYSTEAIGIEAHGGRAVVLLPAGSRTPVARAMTFTTAADGQRAVEVRVVRCRATGMPADVVGRFLVTGLRPGRGGEARIDIGISLDREGMIRAWGVDRHTGSRQEAAFPGLWALDPADRPRAVARMADRVAADMAPPGTVAADRMPPGTVAADRMPPGTVAASAGAPFLAALLGEIASRRRGAGIEPPVAV